VRDSPHVVVPEHMELGGMMRENLCLQSGRITLGQVPIFCMPRALSDSFANFQDISRIPLKEANELYGTVQKKTLSVQERLVQRQIFAGMLWSKQLYSYDVDQWLEGDPASLPPSQERRHGRNGGWRHLNNVDFISMPDKWENPWYASADGNNIFMLSE